jgi:hypothetical protein
MPPISYRQFISKLAKMVPTGDKRQLELFPKRKIPKVDTEVHAKMPIPEYPMHRKLVVLKLKNAQGKAIGEMTYTSWENADRQVLNHITKQDYFLNNDDAEDIITGLDLPAKFSIYRLGELKLHEVEKFADLGAWKAFVKGIRKPAFLYFHVASIPIGGARQTMKGNKLSIKNKDAYEDVLTRYYRKIGFVMNEHVQADGKRYVWGHQLITNKDV